MTPPSPRSAVAVPRLVVVLVLVLAGCAEPPPVVVERTPAGAGELVRVPVRR